MNISGISGALSSGIQDIAPLGGPSPSQGTGEPFSQMIADVLKEARDQTGRMDKDIENLVTGQTDNLHQVVLNVAEADLTFRMLMEVRDRLIASYQEIMRMQI